MENLIVVLVVVAVSGVVLRYLLPVVASVFNINFNLMKTHIEIVALDGKKFITHKNMIVSVSIGKTPDWVHEKYDYIGDDIAIIVVDAKDDEGKNQSMMVKNSYGQLKKLLT